MPFHALADTQPFAKPALCPDIAYQAMLSGGVGAVEMIEGFFDTALFK